jgi:endonuclease/exonuclease/phosphatase family metal-dependent hydrolase
MTSSFSYADADAMQWSRRGAQVLEEMVALDADVFSVQELVRYESFAELNRSHVFLFAPKLKSPALAGGGAGDGVALFVRRSRFEVEDVGVHYFRAPSRGGSGGGSEKLSNQNAIVATLRDRACGRLLVAAATHLKAGTAPGDEAARLWQVEQLVAHVRAAKLAAEAAGGAPLPVVIGGDFNCAPGEKPWLSLLTTLPARSAYNHLSPEGGLEAYAAGEPRFTTFKFRENPEEPTRPREKKVTEDYLFYTDALRVASLKTLPNEESCGAYGLPAAHFPSDHLPLAAQLEWERGL